ncbi:MAG: metalloprotease TldD [Gammaproteobacteria bacterium CG_4_10_14_0_8_um_filter_38_16]|nr:MAG: metalloprotease TldD [Gammaproteobacteria bacterium CG_4_10_14_0_8_um_filter_38_16]PJA02891.1 MAG: metalloprotease TldD [Gammaproteobacteria bacterium CG_4_10_14_0_2_um_filter_38_22]PJB10945.1 MAG: metalloprotease TldD [Gammaproteobacteria bacterium CG_4_9_14_3_um_filter_38_9]
MKNDWLSIDTSQLESALSYACGSNIDAADLFLQQSQDESWVLEDGIVKEGGFSIDRGFGLRVMSGEKTGFAYADQIELPAIIEAAKSARSIVKSGGNALIKIHTDIAPKQLYPAINPIISVNDADKVAFLKALDVFARKMDPRVKQVMLSLSGSYDLMMVMNTQGHVSSDVRPLVHFSVRVIVEEKGRYESASAGCGGRDGYDCVMKNAVAQSQVERAVNQAVKNLTAVPAPAGTFPVVLGPGWPAVLFHEAVGHGLEGDFNRKKTSVYAGKQGEKIASDLCTVVDDGTIPGRRGSLSVDDEGTPTQKTVLIEKGILKNYMQDTLNARLMNTKSTGNGRRESYSSLPLPRMTNTYLLPGDSAPEDIIASVEKGIYAADFSGGQVDITSGKFVFTASEAYLIEKGKITQSIKGATLVGSGHEVLRKISMVGNDLKLDSGIGNCGKAGQTVPVGVGQPTLKIDGMTVGGVSASK